MLIVHIIKHKPRQCALCYLLHTKVMLLCQISNAIIDFLRIKNIDEISCPPCFDLLYPVRHTERVRAVQGRMRDHRRIHSCRPDARRPWCMIEVDSPVTWHPEAVGKKQQVFSPIFEWLFVCSFFLTCKLHSYYHLMLLKRAVSVVSLCPLITRPLASPLHHHFPKPLKRLVWGTRGGVQPSPRTQSSQWCP